MGLVVDGAVDVSCWLRLPPNSRSTLSSLQVWCHRRWRPHLSYATCNNAVVPSTSFRGRLRLDNGDAVHSTPLLFNLDDPDPVLWFVWSRTLICFWFFLMCAGMLADSVPFFNFYLLNHEQNRMWCIPVLWFFDSNMYMPSALHWPPVTFYSLFHVHIKIVRWANWPREEDDIGICS
jgi:hypothetical protein